MTNYLIINFALIIFIIFSVSIIYYFIYKKVINKRLISSEGKKLPTPITVSITTIVTTIVISFILFVILIIVDGFSKPITLSNPKYGYNYQRYEEITPNMQASIYKPYIDEDIVIPGYELSESTEIDNFKYNLYINKETSKVINFIIYLEYIGEIIPDLDTTFGIYSKKIEITKYNGYSSTGIFTTSYFIKGFTEESINLKVVFKHQIRKIKDNQKDVENMETYASFEKEFQFMP